MNKKNNNSFKTSSNAGWIKFLGTAGARFVMIKQLRSSGGIWINAEEENILFDPGPGSLVQCNKTRPALNPESLDAIILSHKHLDHCCDINVMIEAMTGGGFKKRGKVFCPSDALKNDPVILKYTQKLPEEIIKIKERTKYKIDDFEFETSMRHIHASETYGIKFKLNSTSVSILSDTKYFPQLKNFYSTDILIISVTFYEPRHDIAHLCLDDVRKIIQQTNPKKVVLTHFGMSMLKHKPNILAKQLSKELNTEVIAAYDGMIINP
jgi:ribonuclease BN (tRNA processing enzyme)